VRAVPHDPGVCGRGSSIAFPGICSLPDPAIIDTDLNERTTAGPCYGLCAGMEAINVVHPSSDTRAHE
jgi:hypothetical protein